MSTPTTRKSRRKAWAAVAALGAAFGLFLTIGAGSASAAIACTYDGNFGELIVVGDGASDTVTFKRTGGSGGFILVNGATCVGPANGGIAAASVLNVDNVYIDLDGGTDTVVIDNTNGRVTEPGATTDVPPETGLNDIEWTLSDVDAFRYDDTNAAGAVTIGQANGSETWDGDPIADAYPGGPRDFGTPSPGDALLNLNSFPADNDADVWDEDDDFDAITVNGNGGDDFITGKGGNGTGAATDLPLTLNGGLGNNEVEGGLGDDTIVANPGDVLNGNANSPVDVFCDQDDSAGLWVPGAEGGDTLDLSGLAGGFTIVMHEDGSITITPAPAIVAVDFENIVGSLGNDTITGNSLDNFISGGAGNDTIDGMGGDDVVVGGDGDDNLAGGLGDDCVVGNAGNDVLDESKPLNADGSPAYGPFGNGSDALDGGPGLDDTVSYAARTNRTVVYLGIISWFNDGADPNADGVSDECDDVFFTTENAITGSGNDILSADFLNNQSDNEFTAGAGNDQIDGGAGNDILHEQSSANGADVFAGGSGSDTADYSQRSNGVNVSLDGAGNDGEPGEGDNIDGLTFSPGIAGVCGEDNDFWNGGPEPFFHDEATDNAAHSVENVQGGSGNDVLSGNSLGNVLTGNSGNDTISGGDGADNLQGGDGNDILAGNVGNDALDGGAGTDWGDWQTAGVAGVGVQVNLATGVASGEGNDVLTGLESVGGSPFADTLRGDAGANTINGRGGNDAVQGNGGDDVLNGGAGNDEVNGNGGNDTAHGQSGADTVRGAAGNDVVTGDAGNDTVLGGGGNDSLAGGSGKDFLNGNAGTDTCNVGAPGVGNGDIKKNCP